MDNDNKMDPTQRELNALHYLFTGMTMNRECLPKRVIPGSYAVGFYQVLALARARNPGLTNGDVLNAAAEYAESLLN